MLLTVKEKQRIEAIQAVMDERISIREAAVGLGLSERQVFEIALADQGLSRRQFPRHERIGTHARIITQEILFLIMSRNAMRQGWKR